MTVCLVLFPKGKKLLTEKSTRQRAENLIALLVLWHPKSGSSLGQNSEKSLSNYSGKQLTPLLMLAAANTGNYYLILTYWKIIL